MLSGISILVVEDDDIARLMVKQAIKPYCESFYEAKDGLEGLEIFKKYRIDIIITDIHMPNLNGFEMMKEILFIKPKQLFLVMTSYDSDENILKSIQEGAANFLRKPIDMEVLQTFLLVVSGRLNDIIKPISPTVSLDFRKENILVNGEPIYLTHKCHKVFWMLANNLARVITYDMLEDCVYGGEEINKGVLHMIIQKIRQQLPDIHIENISGLGYVLKVMPKL